MDDEALLQQRDRSSTWGMLNEKGINCILLGINLSWLYRGICRLRLPSHRLRFYPTLLPGKIYIQNWSERFSWNHSQSISLGEVVKNKSELRKLEKKKKLNIVFWGAKKENLSFVGHKRAGEQSINFSGFWNLCLAWLLLICSAISLAVVPPFLQQETKDHNIWSPLSRASPFPSKQPISNENSGNTVWFCTIVSPPIHVFWGNPLLC